MIDLKIYLARIEEYNCNIKEYNNLIYEEILDLEKFLRNEYGANDAFILGIESISDTIKKYRIAKNQIKEKIRLLTSFLGS